MLNEDRFNKASIYKTIYKPMPVPTPELIEKHIPIY
jgi:hypothetical protein